MITVDQFRTHIIDYIRLWWPQSKVWSDPSHAGRLATEFAVYDLRDVQHALDQLRAEGGQSAPSPAKLIEKTESVTLARHGKLPGEDTNWAKVCADLRSHHWAIVEERASGMKPIDLELAGREGGARAVKCARCGDQTIVAANRILTDSELDERRRVQVAEHVPDDQPDTW